jgi:hypothetical protein
MMLSLLLYAYVTGCLTAFGENPKLVSLQAKKLASPFVQGPVGQLRGTTRAIPPELEFED